MFGLAFFLNSILKGGNMQTFFLILLMMNGIVVLAQLLDEWTLVLNMVFNIALLIINRRSDISNG